MIIPIVSIIVLACILIYFATGITRTYKSEVKRAISASYEADPGLLTQEDMQGLPELVRNYLSYTGVVGKPKVWNFRVVFDGRMKSNPNSGNWMKINTVQYNFIKNPTRLFYIKGSVAGIPCFGLHDYRNETGTMLVKVLGLVPVVNGKGKEMNEGDCVTLFNDMCFMAPATLIDKRIVWEEMDDGKVKAVFTNGSIQISAVLYFNDKGELVNFVSNNRYMSETGGTFEKLPWSTPVRDYNEINGVKLPSHADAVWTMRDGSKYTYGEFDVKSVEYNCKVLK